MITDLGGETRDRWKCLKWKILKIDSCLEIIFFFLIFEVDSDLESFFKNF